MSNESDRMGKRRLLVVMMHTLAGPTAFAHLHKLASEQPTDFYLMMPALRPDYGLTWTHAQARADAQDRLAIMLEFMTKAGLTASGETRDESPPEAMELVALGPAGPFDGVVVIWRQKKHRWMYRSKGELFEDLLGIPVTAIKADPPLRHSNVEDVDELRRIFDEHAKQEGWLHD